MTISCNGFFFLGLEHCLADSPEPLEVCPGSRKHPLGDKLASQALNYLKPETGETCAQQLC